MVILAAEADIEVIAVCEDSDALLAAIETERPDVVLTDIRMPPTGTDEGIRVADQLRDTHPEIGSSCSASSSSRSTSWRSSTEARMAGRTC